MKKLIKILLVIIWMCLIFNFSAQDAQKSKGLSEDVIIKTVETVKKEKLTEKEKENIVKKYIFAVRKSAHFFLYFVLGILVYLLIIEKYNISIKSLIITIIICLLYSISDELHQLFIDGRSAKFLDVIIDTTGAIISSSLINLGFKLKIKHNK